MSEYKVTLKWERGGAEFSYQKYPRDHTWIFDGGHRVSRDDGCVQSKLNRSPVSLRGFLRASAETAADIGQFFAGR